MILENTIPPFSIGNHFWYVTMLTYSLQKEKSSAKIDKKSRRIEDGNKNLFEARDKLCKKVRFL